MMKMRKKSTREKERKKKFLVFILISEVVVAFFLTKRGLTCSALSLPRLSKCMLVFGCF